MTKFMLVTQPFGGFSKGDLITDQEKVAAIMATESLNNVAIFHAEVFPESNAEPAPEPAQGE